MAPTSYQKATSLASWNEGDIAFLKSYKEFSDIDYQSLINTRYLQPGATGHPVIILSCPSKDSSHVAITTISSYGSGAKNNYLPPWNQSTHQSKNPEFFRSFPGSAQFNNRKQLLQLKNGKLMPKVNTSWVYIQNVWVVPVTTLKTCNKSETRLCMTKESLDDLLAHMKETKKGFHSIINDERLTLKVKPITQTKSHNRKSIAATSSRGSSSDIMKPKSVRPAIAMGSSISRTQIATATSSIQSAWVSNYVPHSSAILTPITSVPINNNALQPSWCQIAAGRPAVTYYQNVPIASTVLFTSTIPMHDPWSISLRPVGTCLVYI